MVVPAHCGSRRRQSRWLGHALRNLSLSLALRLGKGHGGEGRRRRGRSRQQGDLEINNLGVVLGPRVLPAHHNTNQPLVTVDTDNP